MDLYAKGMLDPLYMVGWTENGEPCLSDHRLCFLPSVEEAKKVMAAAQFVINLGDEEIERINQGKRQNPYPPVN